MSLIDSFLSLMGLKRPVPREEFLLDQEYIALAGELDLLRGALEAGILSQEDRERAEDLRDRCSLMEKQAAEMIRPGLPKETLASLARIRSNCARAFLKLSTLLSLP